MITGVVDWSGAAQAPRGLDVSWCRLDLTLLHGPDSAETFLAAYEQAAGAVPDLALWDLFALDNSYRTVETWLPNYHDLGRTDLTAAKLRERHTNWTQECLDHFNGDLGSRAQSVASPLSTMAAVRARAAPEIHGIGARPEFLVIQAAIVEARATSGMTGRSQAR